ncbi:MAG TPA: glycosyltransferase family 1 protein [Terriglobia bacterium]|nr:glycosyltransferase family 1 protein [Terriglobia bacterium]
MPERTPDNMLLGQGLSQNSVSRREEGILYDARWIGRHGIGRFADEISKRLSSLVHYKEQRPPWHPADPLLLSAELWFRKPKVFFSPGYNAPLTCPGPFVFTLHDLHHLRVPEDSSIAKRAYYRHIILPACRRAAFVLTVSEYSKREIVDWARVSEEKVINVGNGIGPPFVLDGPRHAPGYDYLLYVGSRKPHKNLSRLLHAYAISGVRKDVRLVLVSGSSDTALESEIARLGLSGEVLCRTCTSDDELAGLYRGAVAFVFPSLYEGFGLPPLEAMACGTPVLGSKAAAIPEILADAGLLVDPLSVEEIADAIRRLVRDSALRESLRRKGPERARKFTWVDSARKIFEVLQAAASN